jgi:hypothetical protein
MTACCMKLPPLTHFLSDQCGKEPLTGNACRRSMAQSAGAKGASGEDPAAPARVGAVLLALLEPWRRPACGSCRGVVRSGGTAAEAMPDGQDPGGGVWWPQTARQRRRKGWVCVAWATGVSVPKSHRGEGAQCDDAEVEPGAGRVNSVHFSEIWCNSTDLMFIVLKFQKKINISKKICKKLD